MTVALEASAKFGDDGLSAWVGWLTDTIDMVPGGTLINNPAEQRHSLRSLESGAVLLECKDGSWEPLGRRI